ncbi:hypothetical protein Dd586_0891 [Dickeya parazeae Ech586]|uniref:Uncharacterized protein n=1 Tax=Dickeya zeae (strain Ech586) TaxID=590409 RepID=D2BTE0_DICZ5|nr:hypothetical protein Dd586_0891 [Dickeya parazeae Ech586]
MMARYAPIGGIFTTMMMTYEHFLFNKIHQLSFLVTTSHTYLPMRHKA